MEGICELRECSTLNCYLWDIGNLTPTYKQKAGQKPMHKKIAWTKPCDLKNHCVKYEKT